MGGRGPGFPSPAASGGLAADEKAAEKADEKAAEKADEKAAEKAEERADEKADEKADKRAEEERATLTHSITTKVSDERAEDK